MSCQRLHCMMGATVWLMLLLGSLWLSHTCRAGFFSTSKLSCPDCLLVSQHIQAEMQAIEPVNDASLLQGAG